LENPKTKEGSMLLDFPKIFIVAGAGVDAGNEKLADGAAVAVDTTMDSAVDSTALFEGATFAAIFFVATKYEKKKEK